MFYLKFFTMLFVCLIAAFFGTIWAVLFWGNQNVLPRWIWLLSRVILKIAGIRVEVQDAHYLQASQPCVYLLNHQSGLDLVTFGYNAPLRTTVVAKHVLRWVPFIGLFFMATGVIFINRKDRQGAIVQLDKAAETIRKKGVSIAVAPEGTRNEKGEGLLPFKKGPFYMAVKAQIPMVPFLCSQLYPLGSFEERRICSGVLQMKVLPPIPTKELTVDDIDALMAKTRAIMLDALSGLKTRKD